MKGKQYKIQTKNKDEKEEDSKTRAEGKEIQVEVSSSQIGKPNNPENLNFTQRRKKIYKLKKY